MKTRLSMPSTISSAVSVTRLAQTCGSVSHSIGLASDRCQQTEAVKRIRGRKTARAAVAVDARPVLGDQPWLQLALRLLGGARQLGAQLRLGHLDALGGEIIPHLFDDIAVARLFEIRVDHGSGIGLRLVAGGNAEAAGGPQPEQPVAAGGDPELQLLVALELGLETFLAVFETSHVVSSFGNSPVGICARCSENQCGRSALDPVEHAGAHPAQHRNVLGQEQQPDRQHP